MDADKASELLKTFAETARQAERAFRHFARAVFELMLKDDEAMRRMGLPPSLRYAALGSPFGRNRKGKKRWLLSVKNRRKPGL